MKIFLGTQNRGKIEEIRLILSRLSDEIGERIEIVIPDTKESIEEKGRTYEQNALSKALWWQREKGIDLPILSEDSGIEVFSLGGYPGINSSIVPRPDATDHERCMHILELLRKSPRGQRRTARYVSCALLLYKDTWFYDFGYTYGEIAESIRGGGGFGYDPIFFSPEINKTFGESTIEEKTSVSHRKRAIFKLKEVFRKLCQGYL